MLKLAERTFHRIGKLSSDELDKKIIGKIHNKRTALGPRAGVDYGIYGSDSNKIILTTDPLSCHLPLGMEFASKFGFHIILADFMASGNLPEFLTATLVIPESFSDDDLERYWSSFTAESDRWNIDIVTGHTGRYPSARLPLIGSVTMGGLQRSIPPDPSKAQSGDDLYIMGIPGIQAAVIIASYEKDGDKDILRNKILGMKNELIASEKILKVLNFNEEKGGIFAIHDVTEGGLINALYEIADVCSADLELDSEKLNMNEDVNRYLNMHNIDPLRTTSEGCFIIGVKKDESASFQSFMNSQGINAIRMGSLGKKKGGDVYVDGTIRKNVTGDPYWEAVRK